MDIVKPIPAKILMPNIDFQFKLLGSFMIDNLIATKINNIIPTGLPIVNPNKIPKLYFSESIDDKSLFNIIAVLANAKSGNTIKATGLCNKFCKTKELDFWLLLCNGIANANKTPVIVGCKPDSNIKYHINNPNIK